MQRPAITQGSAYYLKMMEFLMVKGYYLKVGLNTAPPKHLPVKDFTVRFSGLTEVKLCHRHLKTCLRAMVMMVSIFTFCQHRNWLSLFSDSHQDQKEEWILTGC